MVRSFKICISLISPITWVLKARLLKKNTHHFSKSQIVGNCKTFPKMQVLNSGASYLKSYPKFSKMSILKSVARKGQNTPKSDFRGPKIPPRVQHETCSTICGTPVQAILDQKNLTELAGGVREGQNLPQNGLNLEPFRGP